MPLFGLDGISDEHSQCTVTAGIGEAQSLRFCGNELDVFDGLVLRPTIDQTPLVFFSVAFICLLALIDSYLGIERASGDDSAKLWPGPFDLPG